MSEFFIPPSVCNGYQLAFLTVVYGYALCIGSSMISDGSELLLLVPSIAGMVGSVVLPVLGAVPDSLMVFFSGLGPDPQATVAVGVGALAGSTIMLLTVPWFLSVYGGRVNLDPTSGLAIYVRPTDMDPNVMWEKLQPPDNRHLRLTGVPNSNHVKKNGRFMMLSALLYLIIQIPALTLAPSHIPVCALAGCIGCLVTFGVYICQQYRAANAGDSVIEERVVDARVDAIRAGEVSLLGAMQSLLQETAVRQSLGRPLLEIPESHVRQLRATLHRFYRSYETQSADGQIGFNEFKTIMGDLGCERLTHEELEALFRTADRNDSGNIDFDEFVHLMLIFIRDFDSMVDAKRFYAPRIESVQPSRMHTPVESLTPIDEESPMEEEEVEEDEVPEDLEHLTPDQQQRRIKLRAAWTMGLGTLLVLVFADPAVDVLNEIAIRMDMSPFFVSFVLAPLASNASEVIAAYNYSLRKTRRTMQVALTTLEGAACLNNTFCLAIFLAVVYARGLEWTFTAEVIAILAVQMGVGWLATRRVAFTLFDGVLILSLYPISLLLVEGLKLAGVN